MGIDPSGDESLQDFRRRLDGSAIATYVLIMVLVPLKLWCRKRAGGWKNLGIDDAITVLALFLANGFFWVCLIGMRKSLGIHVTTVMLDPDALKEFLIYVFAGQLLYVWAIAVIKFSIIAFYWRIFSLTARIPIAILTCVVFAWIMSLNFLVIFTCDPVAASWDITITPQKCMPLKSIYLGGSIPNVITDIVLIGMPIPYVLRLHAPMAQRVILAGMFLLGIFIAVVSIIRLTIFMRIPIATAADVTYNFREVIIWSVVEINVGLVCACLPSLKPAFAFLGLNKLFSFTSSSNAISPGPSSAYPSYGRSGEGSRPRKKGSTGGLFSTLAGGTKMDDESEEYQLTLAPGMPNKAAVESDVTRISSESKEKKGNGGTHGGIQVQTDWSVLVDPKENQYDKRRF